MRSIYMRVRVINRICIILHNPRTLHIATESHDQKDDSYDKRDRRRVGSETFGRVIIENVIGSGSYSTREKKKK